MATLCSCGSESIRCPELATCQLEPTSLFVSINEACLPKRNWCQAKLSSGQYRFCSKSDAMKHHIAPGALFVASVLLGWFLHRVGGSDWLFIYAGAGGPFLMAAMWVLDQGRRRSQRDTADGGNASRSYVGCARPPCPSTSVR